MINPSKPYNIKPTLSKALFHPKYLLTWSGLLILFLLSKLPFKLTLLMGKILSLLLYLFAKKRRKIAEINLQLCFPKKNKTAIQNLTKKTFVNIGKGIFEMAIAWWASDLKIKKIKTSFQKKNILLEKILLEKRVLELKTIYDIEMAQLRLIYEAVWHASRGLEVSWESAMPPHCFVDWRTDEERKDDSGDGQSLRRRRTRISGGKSSDVQSYLT